MQTAKIDTGKSPLSLAKNQKMAVRAWLSGMSHDYPVAITLTLKQTELRHTPYGTHLHKIQRDDVERIAKRFTQKMNREVFGKRQAEKYHRTLKYIVVVEGERSEKRLHLHLAVGGLPKGVRYNQLEEMVARAKSRVDLIDQHYKVDIADSGWITYCCKELGAHDTDNVLWNLC